MRFLENLKRRLGMAKRFKHSSGDRVAKKEEIPVEEIAKRVAAEDIEELIVMEDEPVPEGKMRKEEFLESKGLHDRPNSHMAIKAWEEYQDSLYDW